MKFSIRRSTLSLFGSFFLTSVLACEIDADLACGSEPGHRVAISCKTDVALERSLRSKYEAYCSFWRHQFAGDQRVCPGIWFLEDLTRQLKLNPADQRRVGVNGGEILRMIDTLFRKRVEGIDLRDQAARTPEEQDTLARCIWSLTRMRRDPTASASFTGAPSYDPFVNLMFSQSLALSHELDHYLPPSSYRDYIQSSDFTEWSEAHRHYDPILIQALKRTLAYRSYYPLFYFSTAGMEFLQTNRAWLASFEEQELKSSLEVLSFYSANHLNFLADHTGLLEGANDQEKKDLLYALIRFSALSLGVLRKFYGPYLTGKTARERVTALNILLGNEPRSLEYVLSKKCSEVEGKG
jgi:hypothetical protein